MEIVLLNSLRIQFQACVVVFYPTNTVTVEEQYELFDVNEIVSAVGGSMGLFLGFSCLGTYMSFAKYLLVVHILNSFFYYFLTLQLRFPPRRGGGRGRKSENGQQVNN